MNYQESLNYIFSKLPMFSRIGSEAIKSGLKNIILLNNALGNPETKGKFIHVAGTNGKGSVSHMLAAIFQKAGYKTGLYTSPHLKDIRERVKINGVMMSEEDFAAFMTTIKPVADDVKPSFFELNVAMAFDHFAKYETDIAIIETGLGGRLDSTNVIQPLLSVITNIGFDHVKILGETLAQIAIEKAGIIKQNTPVIIGEYVTETAPVFEKAAAEKNAPLYFASKDFTIENWKYADEYLMVEVEHKHHTDHEKYTLDLPGYYQTKNLITVLETMHCFNITYPAQQIDEKIIKEALKHTKATTGLHGRWETVLKKPRVILDVGHNVDGIQQILKQLEITEYKKLHIILGMVADKDVDAVLSLLPKNADYYFTNAKVPRALLCSELKNKATQVNLHGTCYSDVNEAIKKAVSLAHVDDLVLVCGSVFLIGEVQNLN